MKTVMKLLGSVKGEELFNQLSDYQPFKEDPEP